VYTLSVMEEWVIADVAMGLSGFIKSLENSLPARRDEEREEFHCFAPFASLR